MNNLTQAQILESGFIVKFSLFPQILSAFGNSGTDEVTLELSSGNYIILTGEYGNGAMTSLNALGTLGNVTGSAAYQNLLVKILYGIV